MHCEVVLKWQQFHVAPAINKQITLQVYHFSGDSKYIM